MSKNDKWLQRIFAVLTVLVFMTGIGVMTAYADPGDDGGEAVADDGGEIDGSNDNNDGGSSSSQSGDSSSSAVSDQGNADNDPDQGDNNDNGDGNNDNNVEPATEAPISIPEQIDDLRKKYLGDDEEPGSNDSDYTPNKNLDNLPTVASEAVAAATAEPLPDVEVSDATLFSGIIMWVCVAVGVSVVAGVMVSKRTHRRGP